MYWRWELARATGPQYSQSLAGEVVTVERHQNLAEAAAEVLAELGYDNVTVVKADGSLGYAAGAPYSAVVVTASTENIPVPVG